MRAFPDFLFIQAADDSASHLSMTLDAALAEGEGLMKDLDELDTLVRGAEGGFQDEDKGSSSPRLRGGDGEDVSGEKAVDDGESLSLKPTAEEDSLSADLFTELSTLNAELEAMGVKAFGELEESAYRFPPYLFACNEVVSGSSHFRMLFAKTLQ